MQFFKTRLGYLTFSKVFVLTLCSKDGIVLWRGSGDGLVKLLLNCLPAAKCPVTILRVE